MNLPRTRRTAAQLMALACLCVHVPAQNAVSPATDPARAADAYLAGARAVDHGDFASAQSDFARATALDPSRSDYALAFNVTRQHRVGDLIQQAARARLGNHADQADKLIQQASLVDPASELVLEHLNAQPTGKAPEAKLHTQIMRPPELVFAQPVRLEPGTQTIDLRLKGDVKQVVAQAAKAFGVKVVFDDSVTAQELNFSLDATTYDQAMPILLKMTHLFSVPVDSKTLLIAKETQENRTKFERLFEETIFVPGSTAEQLNELTNVVKNIFDVKQAVVSANLGTLVLRAPEPTLKAVNVVLSDLLDGGADVLLDIKLVTIDKSHTRNLGVQPPSGLSAFSVAAEAQSLVAANQSVLQAAIASGALVLPSSNTAAQNLLAEAVFLFASGLATDVNLSGFIGSIGGGLTLLGVSYAGNVLANFALNSSEARALDDLTVRVGDRQTTVLRVGEKYPITTATYSSGLSASTTAALANTTIGGVSAASLLAAASTSTVPMIQFEDLGLTLKTTPTVLKSGLVSVHLDLKIEALTGASLDNIPVLTSRNFVSDISMAEGTTAMMVSDLSRTEASSVSGIPGLANLPGFSQSVSDTLRERDSSELVLLVTPHLVRRRSSVFAGPRIAFSTSVPQDD